ncbi:hypothetical protein [Eubacterium maltosivorans]|nr:hypothetical protein [Eubacterium maltosivorans]
MTKEESVKKRPARFCAGFFVLAAGKLNERFSNGALSAKDLP